MPLPDRLTPVYPTTAGLSQETLRSVIARAMTADEARTAETLPEDLVRRWRQWKFGDAVEFLHHPPPRLPAIAQKSLDARTHPAWTRLKFDELLAQQLSMKAHREARAARRAPVLTGTGVLTRRAGRAAALPAHAGAGARGAGDRARPQACDPRCSACCRATWVRARPSSPPSRPCRRSRAGARSRSWRPPRSSPSSTSASSPCGSKTSACASPGCPDRCPRRSREAREALASAAARLRGRHARPLPGGVELPTLGLAIVDEQHRFGVAQRLALRGKGLAEAHQLMMSATPIPRTLAMTLLRRPRRLGASTSCRRAARRSPRGWSTRSGAPEIVAWVGKLAAEGRQAYWVCPLIEESEKLELQTAVALHAELDAASAPERRSRWG